MLMCIDTMLPVLGGHNLPSRLWAKSRAVARVPLEAAPPTPMQAQWVAYLEGQDVLELPSSPTLHIV